MKFGRNVGGEGHHGLVLGRLEVLVWRDTGKPRFRLWGWRYRPRLYTVPTFLWIVKLMSWWTLWVAWRAK